jgi:hypothetical protein
LKRFSRKGAKAQSKNLDCGFLCVFAPLRETCRMAGQEPESP